MSNKIFYVLNNDTCSSSEDSSKHNCFDIVQDDVGYYVNNEFIKFIESDDKSKKKNKTDFFFNIPKKYQFPRL